jgi:hypothetical protein
MAIGVTIMRLGVAVSVASLRLEDGAVRTCMKAGMARCLAVCMWVGGCNYLRARFKPHGDAVWVAVVWQGQVGENIR